MMLAEEQPTDATAGVVALVVIMVVVFLLAFAADLINDGSKAAERGNLVGALWYGFLLLLDLTVLGLVGWAVVAAVR